MSGSSQHLAGPFSIRQAQPGDVSDLVELLNQIICAGGTTAIEDLLTGAEFERWFLSGPDCVVCNVAVTPDLRIAGFQSLEKNSRLLDGWVDVATFTRRPRVPGVGSALFPVTRDFARNAGFKVINATIRADNEGGLAYYTKMGFVDYQTMPAVPLGVGRPVDRVSKRYDMS